MYSRKTHLEMAALLRRAKGNLWDGKCRSEKTAYICHALPQPKNKNEIVIWRNCMDWIGSLLKEYGSGYTLRDYIERKTKVHYDCVQMQAMRQDFIDYLIEVLEAE